MSADNRLSAAAWRDLTSLSQVAGFELREHRGECDCEMDLVEGRWVRLYCAACRVAQDAE